MTVTLLPRKPRVLILDLTIEGEPVPKARARITRRGNFTPARTLHSEMAVEWLMRGKLQTATRGPIIVECDFFLGNNRRVDIDNLWKLVSDAGNGIVWDDDSQIVDLTIHKHIDKSNPRTEILVWKVVQE